MMASSTKYRVREEPALQEEELIKRSKKGDLFAFEELLRMYEKKVYAIAYRYMGNREDAMDMAQEAFLKAYQAIGSFRGESAFGTWVGRIVSNKCLDELRRRRNINITSFEEEVELEEGSLRKEVAAPDASPEEQYLQQEKAEYLQRLIDDMRPDYKAVIIMREVEGRTYDEIAAEMNCSLGTIKSRLSRARNYLKERIERERVKGDVLP